MLRFAAVVSCALVMGCASVTRGANEQIQINTDPAGAEARTSIGFACVTPCVLQVPRKTEFSVVITKEGYQPEHVMVRTQVGAGGASGFAGNIIIGGGVGMIADVATGAALDHCPNPITVFLRPIARGPKPAGSPRPDGHCTVPPNAGDEQTYKADN